MDQYVAPVDDIIDALETAGLRDVLALAVHGGTDVDAVRSVLEGFAKLASDVIAPTDAIGDRYRATFEPSTGAVAIPDELAVAYQAYVDGGWHGLAAATEHGGGGLPGAVATAVHEMFGSANLALSLNPMLTRSAVELLERWATMRQREIVLPRLVDGTWTGTMNLTEPDAGSDLGAIRAIAEPAAGGRWLINGTKIFITWGEHDLTDNVIHLVLARTPAAPAGTKGISLFLVPKRHIDDTGAVGELNGVHCRGLEHKLGIHASPTCVIEFTDAVGELVGPLHGGMAAMFHMMNPARLAVGVQGVSVGERAFQQAHHYALERRQGHVDGVDGPAPIIEHPDVQRMLVDIAATRDAIRLLTYATAVAGDLAAHHPDVDQRARAQRRADLLTPLAKAWPTDQGVRLASTALQIHGGMGYIEETGIAQRYRDARIAPIYEGTNGIQAIDLIGRKIVRDHGVAVDELFAEIHTTITAAAAHYELHASAAIVDATLASARTATGWIVDQFDRDRHAVLAGATSYLELLSVVTAADLMLQHVLRDLERGAPTTNRSIRRTQFFIAHHVQHAPGISAITFGLRPLTDALG